MPLIQGTMPAVLILPHARRQAATAVQSRGEEGLRGMDLAEEDWEGYVESANEISPGGTFSDVALAVAQKNSFLHQLTEQAKMEYAARSNAGRPTDGASLLSGRARHERRCRAGSRRGSAACWMTAVS